ncbi:MAG TPA: hypothetical protein VLK84_03280 [Longimicrobium sp.]|nr:hypothetical protein [Longimicrobium sp.]
MRAAQEQERLIDGLSVQVSEMGVWVIDQFRKSLSPEHLAAVQDFVRSGLLNVERRIRDLRRRTPRKKRYQAECREADAATRRRIGEHNDHARRRDRALITHRNILRQIGDACAWVVLRENARIISVLFDETKQHHLAEGIGLAGPLELAQRAHRSGEFYVIENDLTRCLGTGDITVVRTNGRWLRPLTLEVKSTGEFREGAMLGVHLVTASSDSPVDEMLLGDFVRILNMEVREGTQIPRNAIRQSKELLTRSELMLALTTTRATQLGQPTRALWQSLQEVLDEAGERGFAFREVESGVVYLGVDTERAEDPKTFAEHIRTELRTAGYAPDNNPWHAISTEEMRENDATSAYVAPIALWDLRPETRVALLSGRMYFQCIYDPAVWENALREFGIVMQIDPDGDGWVLRKGKQLAQLGAVEVQCIRAGLAFSGMSPTELAERIRHGFSA